ncbi:hypothetical protein LZQ00_09460 [Sphingobacterium sp. SRCM116780]|uniref:hypothetical protein n=1 Tax=Sphingobacterium sp. SRCM116780 TaxID=2907623 RepID=UPI001F2399AB|nr:hypothetical protein [Sphingobacterium sp. SRCM116780]UIR54498.1 hypothetical protein LZQ00_09460 [Sphingobacterium sp. SRCM116780]
MATQIQNNNENILKRFESFNDEQLVQEHNFYVHTLQEVEILGRLKVALIQEFKRRNIDISTLVEKLDEGLTAIRLIRIQLVGNTLIPLEN